MIPPSGLCPFDIIDDDPFTPHFTPCGVPARPPFEFMTFTWHAHIQGTCLQVIRKEHGGPDKVMPERGIVTVFTAASRLKLFRYLNRINWSKCMKCLFVTVTYPDSADFLDYTTRNKHRFLLMRDIEKLVGKKVPTVWRCEWKNRKSGARLGMFTPHFHLILFGIDDLPKGVLQATWAKSIQHTGFVSVDVKPMKGHQGALRYLAKYVSKEEPLDIEAYLHNGISVGRHWGITRKSLLPMADVAIDRELTDEEVGTMQVLEMERNPHYNPDSDGGFTHLGILPVVNALEQMGK